MFGICNEAVWSSVEFHEMCGVVAVIGKSLASSLVLEGLKKLEYRGYDSAGIATVFEGNMFCTKAKGKLYNLREKLERESNFAKVGIGHTRWATHGKPEEYNAHPHINNTKQIAVVQNGIIENHQELREKLIDDGYQFTSQTDTEVIPHLIAKYISKEMSHDSLLNAVKKAIDCLNGSFAIAVICADFPDEIIVARNQAPLIIGFGQGEFFCASDVTAIVPHTNTVLSLSLIHI